MKKDTRLAILLTFLALLNIHCATGQVPPPPAASQAEVNAGTVKNKYVSPLTLSTYSIGNPTNGVNAGQATNIAYAVYGLANATNTGGGTVGAVTNNQTGVAFTNLIYDYNGQHSYANGFFYWGNGQAAQSPGGSRYYTNGNSFVTSSGRIYDIFGNVIYDQLTGTLSATNVTASSSMTLNGSTITSWPSGGGGGANSVTNYTPSNNSAFQIGPLVPSTNTSIGMGYLGNDHYCGIYVSNTAIVLAYQSAGTNSFTVNGALNVLSNVNAGTFTGNGAGLTNLPNNTIAFQKLNNNYIKTVWTNNQTAPTTGGTVTLANITGSGMVKTLHVGMDSDLSWSGRLQIFTDGEAIPDIDCDMGTLFLSALDAHLGVGGSYETENMTVNIYGSGGQYSSAHSNVVTAAIRFPMPYTNGFVVKMSCPSGSGGGPIFCQCSYLPNFNMYSNYRLRAAAISWANSIYLPNTSVIDYFDLKNASGTLVWKSLVTRGATATDFNERTFYYGVDGESLTPGRSNIVNTAFMGDSEDETFTGYYWIQRNSISGRQNLILTANTTNTYTTIYGLDFLSGYGGITFTNELDCGTGLKDGAFNSSANQSFAYLFYQNIAIPYPPSAPSLTASSGNGQATLTIKNPWSQGSLPITKFYLSVISNSVVVQNISFMPTNSYTVTSLINGTNYNLQLAASNNIGLGITSSIVSVTPTSATNTLGMVEWFKFASTNLAGDSSGNGHNLTLTGLPTSGSGPGSAGAIVLSGSLGQYATNNYAAVYPYTITAWVNGANFSSGNQPVGQFTNAGNWYGDYININSSTGAVAANSAYNNTFGSSTGNTISVGSWHFLVGVFTSTSNRTVYVDGVVGATDTTVITAPPNTGLYIGAVGNGTGSFPGSLSDVRVFARVLNSGEILNMYNYGAVP